MGQPAAKENDLITAVDTHIVLVPAVGPTPLPHPFSGMLNGNLSKNVKIMGSAAATEESTADNKPPHIPTPPGTSFQNPPKNKGTIKRGSTSVKINRKGAARNGDTAETCNDPQDLPVGTVVAVGSVFIGG